MMFFLYLGFLYFWFFIFFCPFISLFLFFYPLLYYRHSECFSHVWDLRGQDQGLGQMDPSLQQSHVRVTFRSVWVASRSHVQVASRSYRRLPRGPCGLPRGPCGLPRGPIAGCLEVPELYHTPFLSKI